MARSVPDRRLIAPLQAPAARDPPPPQKDFHPDARTHLGEPLPEYELDQRVSW